MGKGPGKGQPAPSLVKSEFFTYTAFMLVLMFIVAAGESYDPNPPDWWMETYLGIHEDEPTGPNGNGTLVKKEVQLLSEDGSTSEGATTEKTFDIEDPNTISIAVTLEWTDDIGSNDVLGLALSNESGELATDQGTSGSLAVSIDAPEGSETGEGALVGGYTVSISAIDCPGMIGPLPVDRDTGNSWTLTVIVTVEGPA